ncbi:MAG: peptidoglycan DD-metalloendopeptidase family protein [Oscillospiraceae bacterium]|jgi:hypothetical protein|nr:peptidoglycan DD-metalloendopeptidase family protein [Oscillospiraceae bacterium]
MTRKKLTAVALCVALLLPLFSSITAFAGKYYLLWPTPGYAGITSGYGDNRSHWAIDIAAPKGTPIISSAAGQVIAVNTSCTHNYGKSYVCCDSRGNYVLIRNTSPINGQTVEVRYIHMTSVYVSVGQHVTAGQQIGTVGSTGYSTGNHLDYKLYLNGTAVDPGPYLQIPSNLYYAGSNWSANAAYIAKLKSYNNTEYDPGSGGSNLMLQSGYNYPILILKGNNFNISGTVSSTKKLTFVEARIVSPDGSVKYKASATPNATTYSLANLAGSLRFRSLSEGFYAYEIVAKDESMSSNYQLLYSPFTVSDKATIAPMAGYTYPVSLKPGQSFSIKGKLASINPMTAVSVSIVSTSGETKISQTRSVNTSVYDLADMDSSVKFNTLPEGTYYYRVTAKDNKGNTVTAINDMFYVSNKTGIVGEVSVGGFFLAPTPGKALTMKADLEPAGAQYAIQWFADGEAISGQTGSTFTPTFAHRGKEISVKITGTGNYIGVVESGPTNKVFALTDNKFSIDLVNQTVSPAPIGTTVETLTDNLTTDFIFTGVYDKEGKKLSGEDVLVTGYELKSVVLGITMLRYYVVVQGDLNGDNRLTAEDARLALRGSAGVGNLKVYQTKAGDANNDGTLTANDARMLLRVSAKLESLPVLM